MKNRLNSGLIGRARRVLVVGVPAVGLAVAMVGVAPAQQAFAQDIGADIAETVAAAVADIATTSDGGTVLAGISFESNQIELGEADESTAISDASGGNGNVTVDSGSRHGE